MPLKDKKRVIEKHFFSECYDFLFDIQYKIRVQESVCVRPRASVGSRNLVANIIYNGLRLIWIAYLANMRNNWKCEVYANNHFTHCRRLSLTKTKISLHNYFSHFLSPPFWSLYDTLWQKVLAAYRNVNIYWGVKCLSFTNELKLQLKMSWKQHGMCLFWHHQITAKVRIIN
jgi:hypothetical protein